MKPILNIPILLTTALAMTSVMTHASQSFASGNLALVFYALGESPGSSIGSEYYVFNLGSAAGFRENTQNNVAVKTVNSSIDSSNIATDLSDVFGPTWAEGGKVRMMVVTTIPPAGVLTDGDPTRTIYYSVPRTNLNTGDKGADPNTVFGPLSYTLRNQCSGSLTQFLGGTNDDIPTALSGTNLSGVRLSTSSPKNLSLVIPPVSTTYFKLGTDPAATLGIGQLSGTAGVEAAVDVFRVIAYTEGADLTSGSSTGDVAIGDAQYIGSITLDSTGNLKVQAVGVASGNYTSWAATHNVTGGANGDSDQDGVRNLVEYALLLNPAGSDGAIGTYSGGTLSFTKRPEAVANNDVSYTIQVSSDLGVNDPWSPVAPATNTATEITYALTQEPGVPKKFARLMVNAIP